MSDQSSNAQTQPAKRILRDYLSESALAQELGKVAKTLHRWRRTKRGPKPTKIGRSVYYSRESVLRWLTEQEARIPAKAEQRRRHRE